MPFTAEVKAEMFIKCSRICCLCLKQCGTNIEAHHIHEEAKGGPNTADNGIPVCFDCHQEIGAYNKDHPKGNKFSEKELKGRRNKLFKLVDSGTLQAQIVAAQTRAVGSKEITLPAVDAHQPSKEGKDLAKKLLTQDVTSPHRKVGVLSEKDRAFVVDELLNVSQDNARAVEALCRIGTSTALSADAARVVFERLIRNVALFGDVDVKTRLFENIPPDTLASTEEPVRASLFEDAIKTIREDQYAEVNTLVPALVQHTGAVPSEMAVEYVDALIEQADSDAHKGAPAARSILAGLPDSLAVKGLEGLRLKTLEWHGKKPHVKAFVTKHLSGLKKNTDMLKDFVELSWADFEDKYFPVK